MLESEVDLEENKGKIHKSSFYKKIGEQQVELTEQEIMIMKLKE